MVKITVDDVEVFNYTATDAYGNTVDGTIKVNVIDDVPSITTNEVPTSFELVLSNYDSESSAGYHNSFGYYIKDENGNPTIGKVVWDDVHDNDTTSVTVTGYTPDQIGFFLIPNGDNKNPSLTDDADVVFVQDTNGDWQAQLTDGTLLVGQGSEQGAHVLFDETTLNYDSDTNAYVYAVDNNLAGNINWEDIRGGGDRDNNDVNVNADWTQTGPLGADESDLSKDATFDFGNSGVFNFNFGADGQSSVDAISYNLNLTSGDSGLFDTATGDEVVLQTATDGSIKGVVSENGVEVIVFTLSTTDAGVVTLDQVRAVVHGDTTDSDDTVGINTGLISLDATIIDGDGDSVTNGIDVGSMISFDDDGAIAFTDIQNINEGDTLTVSATNGVLSNDNAGTDGWNSTGAVVGIVAGNTGTNLDGSGVATAITGTYGTLTLASDGSYTYEATSNAITSNAKDVFTYTVKDGDGELSTTTLTINVADVTLEADEVQTTSNQDTDDAVLSSFSADTNTPAESDIAFFKKLDIGGGLDGDLSVAENDSSDPADLGGGLDGDLSVAENDSSDPADLGGKDGDADENTLKFDITTLPNYGDVYIQIGTEYTKLDTSNLDESSTLLTTADNVYWVATHDQVTFGSDIQSIGGEYGSDIEASWQNINVDVIARTDSNGTSTITYNQNDGIGVSGTTGGPSSQLGYDAGSQSTELIIVDFNNAVGNATIDITHLIGTENGGEVGVVTAYLDGKEVGTYTFSNEDGSDFKLSDDNIGVGNDADSNSGSFTLTGIVFDQLQFSAQEYVNQAGTVSDSSDYFIGGITYQEVPGVEFEYNVIDTDGNVSEDVKVQIDVETNTDIPNPTVQIKLNDNSVVELDNGTATITGSLDNTPETELVVTLDNGATITFGTDYVPGTEITSTAFAINNDEDVYADDSNFTISVSSTTGGNFENLIVTDTAKVIVTDTEDVTEVKLSATESITTTLLTESFENTTNGEGTTIGDNSWYVENGNSDTNTFVGDDNVTWTVNNAGLEIQSGTTGESTASDGEQHAELDPHGNGNSVISTTVNLGENNSFELSFDYKPRPSDKDSSDMKVIFGDKELEINSDSEGNLTFVAEDGIYYTITEKENGWNTVTATFVGITGETADLVFEGTGTANTLGAYIDDIKLDGIYSEVVEGGSENYTINIDNAPQTDMKLDVKISHIDTDSGDIITETIQIDIDAGIKSVDFDISNIDNFEFEPNEDYTVELTGASTGGNFEKLVIDTTPVTTTIIDNDLNTVEANDDYGQSVVQGEFTIGDASITTAGDLSKPDITALEDGGYVVVWQEVNGNNYRGADVNTSGDATWSTKQDFDIFSQRFDKDGEPVHDAMIVNSYTARSQHDPHVTALEEGNYLVTWTADDSYIGQDDHDNGSRYIRGQIFDEHNESVCNEFEVARAEYDPIIGLVDGGFIVTWSADARYNNTDGGAQDNPIGTDSHDSDEFGVFGQRYDALGNAVGGHFQINSETSENQIDSDITAFDDGSFIVTWQSENQDGSGYGIFAQRFTLTDDGVAKAGSELQVNTTVNGEQTDPEITTLPSGQAVVTWESEGSIKAQVINNDGSKVGGELSMSDIGDNPVISPIATGFIIAYESNGAIFTKTYEDGELSEVTQVSTSSADQSEPVITTLADGGYIVSWQNGDTVSAMRYQENGEPFEQNSYDMNEDTSITISVEELLSNDADAQNHDFEILTVQNSVNGTVELSIDKTTVTFTPNDDYNGPATFDYTIKDELGATDDATVHLDVKPVGEPSIFVGTLCSADIHGHDVVVQEGEEVVFGVKVSGVEAGSTITLALADGTALDNDYYEQTFQYSFDDQTWQDVTGPITLPEGTKGLMVKTDTVDDNSIEDDEKFTLTATLSTGESDVGTATIINDDFDTTTTATVSIVDANDQNAIIDASDETVEKATIRGEIEPGALITSLAVTDGTTTIEIVPSTVTIDADGTFTIENFDVSSLKDGTLTVNLSSKDTYGNTADATNTVEMDTKATIEIDSSVITSTADATFTAHAYNGDNFMTGNGNSLGSIKLNSINETAISTEHGVGIQLNKNESDEGIDDNETLLIQLDSSTSSATFNLNVPSNESFEGGWVAFDVNGDAITTGTFTSSGGDRTITIDNLTSDFAYIAFDADTSNGNASDSGFYVEPVSYIDDSNEVVTFNTTTETLDLSGTTTDIEVGQTVLVSLTDDEHTVTIETLVKSDGSYDVSGADVSELDAGNISISVEARDTAGNPASDSSSLILIEDDTSILTQDTNNGPETTDDTVSTIEDTSKVLGIDNFGNYTDADGDSLSAVQIVTLPLFGTLILDGVNVIEGQKISVDDISNNKLIFEPADDSDVDVTFDFKVSDDKDWSDVSTTTIEVVAVADVVTANIVIGNGTAVEGTSTPQTIDISNVNNQNSEFTMTATDANGKVANVSVVSGTAQGNYIGHDGFGVSGSASGADTEIGYDNTHGTEKLMVNLGTDVNSVDVSFAWKHEVGAGETAVIKFYKDGELVGETTDHGGSDTIDAADTFSPANDAIFDSVEFSAVGNDSDYLIHSIEYDKVDTVDSTVYPVNISYTFGDSTDSSETHSVIITNVPDGVTLSEGVQNIGTDGKPDGTWTITVPEDATSVLDYPLTITVPNGTADFDLGITARATETNDNELETNYDETSASVSVIVNDIPDDVDGSLILESWSNNLILNGDAESAKTENGQSEWITDSGTLKRSQYEDNDWADKEENNTTDGKFFYGRGEIVIAHQDIKDFSNYKGNEFKLSADMGSYIGQNDSAELKVVFKDASGNILGEASTGKVMTESVMENQEVGGLIPEGAVSATIVMTMIRVDGANDADGYIDNMSFVVGNSGGEINTDENNASIATLDMDIGDEIENTGTNLSDNDVGSYDAKIQNNSYDDNQGIDDNLELDKIQNASVYTNAGDDTIKIDNKIQDSYIDTGSDDDQIIIDGQLKSSTIEMGTGNDVLNLGTINGSSYVNMGSGNDVLILDGNQGDYRISDYGNGDYSIQTPNNKWLSVDNTEAIIFKGDNSIIGDTQLANSVFNGSGIDSFSYKITLSASLTDTDSESLSVVTINNIPTDASIELAPGIEKIGDSYTVDLSIVSEVTLSSPLSIEQSELNSITSSVTATEENGGSTTTVTVSDDDSIMSVSFDDEEGIDLSTISVNGEDTHLIDMTNGAEDNIDLSSFMDLNDDDKDLIFIRDDGDVIDFGISEEWTRSENSTTKVDGVEGNFTEYISDSNPDVSVFVNEDIDPIPSDL